jgi:NTE family protein
VIEVDARLTERLRDAVPTALTGLRREPRTAFVFGGGASLGALQAGMVRALFEQGITADLFVGTSAGALNAAYLATRPQTVETAVQLGRVWSAIRRDDVFPVHPMTLLGGLASHRDHLVPDRSLRLLISRHLELEDLQQAEIPLHVVCFDLHAGEEVRLSAGPALDAVLAAAAIPGVFPPVRRDDQLLVDGGVVNNTPISHAIELGAERIYVLPSEDPNARGVPVAPRGAIDAAVRAFTLLVGARLEADLERYADAADLIVLPAANPDHVQPTDFDHADDLIRGALVATRAILKRTAISQPLAA